MLDNFATVDEVVAELSKELFRIDDPDLPNGAKSTLHLSVSDTMATVPYLSISTVILSYIRGVIAK